MIYTLIKIFNKVSNVIGFVMLFIVGIGMVFGGVMLFTVEKSIIPFVPIAFGLMVLAILCQKLFGKYINWDFGMEQFLYCYVIMVILVFAGMFLVMLTTTVQVMVDGEVTRAQITGVGNNGIPYLEYVANGEKYSNIYLGTSSPGMDRGSWIKVAYYPENPEVVYYCGPWAFIFSIGGLLVMGSVIGFVIYRLVVSLKKKVSEIAFETTGRIVWGVVDKIELDLENKVYDEHPWILWCSYKLDDLVIKCKSKQLNFDPSFCYNIGDPIEIRVDYEDFTKYEVILDLSRVASVIER